ncbi:MAG: hypothetical protein GY821_08185 [Gammaproteobacteria bacterium]|nr:hypothetical protein [Gammaproteobacteria bacterium]MCP4474525.1 hypothetical protein [Gammaproteobacteria bacterium]
MTHPVNDDGKADHEPPFSTYYHVDNATKSSTQVQVTFGNSTFDRNAQYPPANWYKITVKDARGHQKEYRINVDFFGAH